MPVKQRELVRHVVKSDVASDILVWLGILQFNSTWSNQIRLFHAFSQLWKKLTYTFLRKLKKIRLAACSRLCHLIDSFSCFVDFCKIVRKMLTSSNPPLSVMIVQNVFESHPNPTTWSDLHLGHPPSWLSYDIME